MLSRSRTAQKLQIQLWPIDRLVFYVRNPRRNDAAVDRMCASIGEFGFKIPCLVRSDGELVDGELRLKAARKLGLTEVPVILCDEWTPTQVKAFRLLVNRSATWAEWDEELLALELQELNEAGFDPSLTGFDQKEIDDLLLLPDDDEKENAAPPLPDKPNRYCSASSPRPRGSPRHAGAARPGCNSPAPSASPRGRCKPHRCCSASPPRPRGSPRHA